MKNKELNKKHCKKDFHRKKRGLIKGDASQKAIDNTLIPSANQRLN